MSIADKLQTIAENEQKVYEAGKSNGYNEGFADKNEFTAEIIDGLTAYADDYDGKDGPTIPS